MYCMSRPAWHPLAMKGPCIAPSIWARPGRDSREMSIYRVLCGRSPPFAYSNPGHLFAGTLCGQLLGTFDGGRSWQEYATGFEDLRVLVCVPA